MTTVSMIEQISRRPAPDPLADSLERAAVSAVIVTLLAGWTWVGALLIQMLEAAASR